MAHLRPLFILLVVASLAICITSATSKKSRQPEAGCITNATFPYRLPLSVIPTHYNLSFYLGDPNEGALSFQGALTINVTVMMPTTCIVLNSQLISFAQQEVSFTSSSSSYSISATAVAFDTTKTQVTISFGSPLPLGEGVLSIAAFQGAINSNDATGFFISDNSFQPQPLGKKELTKMMTNWLNKGKEKHDGREAYHKLIENILARHPSHEEEKIKKPMDANSWKKSQGLKMYATQFELPYARRAFPCFDDPGLKATFQAMFVVPSGRNLTVLFNTPQQSNYTSGNVQVFTFGTTPHPMANYLVAFAIGNFDYVEQISNGTPFRIYTPPGASQYGKFALNVSVSVTQFFGDLWNLPYSKMMPKMDQIAVPAIDEDAMENWGLLTYASSFLLVDDTPGHYSLPQIQLIALVTTHEIAHQWFGDSITLPWWNQCYLNEGFARFLQFVGVDYLFPEWYIWTLGGSNSYYNFAYESVMGSDIYGYGLPVITSPQQANGDPTNDEKYGCTGVAYGKGAALNRYMSLYAGNSLWNQALSDELNNHLWSNPDVYDLMASFEGVGLADVSTKFLPWLFQSGFPVLRLVIDNSNTLTLTQTPISKYLPQNNSLWWIYAPLRGSSASGNEFSLFVEFQSESVSIDLPAGDWLVEANYNFSAYLAVAYGEAWPAVIARVASPNYQPVVDQQLLIQSLYYLTVMSHEKLIHLLEFYDAVSSNLAGNINSANGDTQDFTVNFYSIIFGQVFSLAQVVKTEGSIIKPIQTHLTSHLLSDAASVLGWGVSAPGRVGAMDSDLSTLRSSTYFWSVYFGLNSQKQPIVNQAIALFNKYGTKLPTDIKGAVYLALVMYNGTTGYHTIQQLYQITKGDSPDKPQLLLALANAPSTLLCAQTIKVMGSASTEDKLALAAQMLRFNPNCKDIAWSFYAQQSTTLWQQQGAAATQMIAPAIQDTLYTQADYSAVMQLLQQNRQYVPTSVAQNILTRVLINGDLVAFNKNN